MGELEGGVRTQRSSNTVIRAILDQVNPTTPHNPARSMALVKHAPN